MQGCTPPAGSYLAVEDVENMNRELDEGDPDSGSQALISEMWNLVCQVDRLFSLDRLDRLAIGLRGKSS